MEANLPCGLTFKSSGSTMTSGNSWSALSLFLASPHRLDPPCMLGMLRTAIPSRERLLRSSGVPQNWMKPDQMFHVSHSQYIPNISQYTRTSFHLFSSDAPACEKILPQWWDTPLVSYKTQRWSQRWQIQSTKVCSSFWKMQKCSGFTIKLFKNINNNIILITFPLKKSNSDVDLMPTCC